MSLETTAVCLFIAGNPQCVVINVNPVFNAIINKCVIVIKCCFWNHYKKTDEQCFLEFICIASTKMYVDMCAPITTVDIFLCLETKRPLKQSVVDTFDKNEDGVCVLVCTHCEQCSYVNPWMCVWCGRPAEACCALWCCSPVTPASGSSPDDTSSPLCLCSPSSCCGVWDTSKDWESKGRVHMSGEERTDKRWWRGFSGLEDSGIDDGITHNSD